MLVECICALCDFSHGLDRGAFVQVAQVLRQQYPDMEVIPSNYPVSPAKVWCGADKQPEDLELI